MPTIQLKNSSGNAVDFEVGLDLYKKAAENKRNVRIQARYEAAEQGLEWDRAKGDLMDQMYTASGLFDGQFGGNSPSMADLQKQNLSANFRRGDGNDDSVGARLLFPQLILETLQENALDDDGGDIIGIWNSMIAINRNLNGARAEQPIINTKGPEGSRSGRVVQLAEPETMVSITTGEKSYRIPTKSIGLLISDEAREATTVDLVRIVMEAQARGDRIARINEQLKAMVNGDDDLDMDALPVKHAYDYDDSLSTNGGISKLAYIKWLNRTQSKANVTRVLTNVENALDLDEALTSKSNVDPGKIQAPFNGVDLGIPSPKFQLFDSKVFGADIMVGLDPRYAIQRFVNVSASYDAVEDYVMRKATGFRVDYGELATRLYDDAWSVLSLSKK